VDLDGILLIDKEVGRTSFETVRLVKKRIGAHKAGHAGTLDKSASGLLIVCVNRATAIQNLLMGHLKKYCGTMRFGIETDTLDRYGQVVRSGSPGSYSDDEIRAVLNDFRGNIEQVPPVYSALHRNGKRLYRRVLNGEVPEVQPRTVEIREISLVRNGGSEVVIEVVASRGTYVRSLVRDIAFSLGTCGYLAELRRVSIGSFSINGAVTADEVTESTPLVSMLEALNDIPQIEVGEDMVSPIMNGAPAWKVLKDLGRKLPQSEYICLIHGTRLLAIVQMKPKPGYLKVFGNLDDKVTRKGLEKKTSQ
jgi:tRNA pseudouridine55 synthase